MRLWGQLFERDANLIAILALVAGIAFAAGTLAIYSYSVSESETVTTTLATYEQLGRYSYTVETNPSPLNPSAVIGPIYPESLSEGDGTPTIFTRLAKKIHVLFVYKLSDASEVAGTVSADLTIKAGESWSQKIPLAEPVSFTGAVGGVEGTIDVVQITSLVTRIKDQTGLESDSVELTITPRVDVQGIAGGQQFSESFSSPLTFVYTEDLITPGETLAHTEPGEITLTSERTNELRFLGAAIPVSTIRTLAAPPAVAALTLTALLAATWFFGIGRPEAAVLRSRYGSLVVPVTDVEAMAGYRVSVESLFDLVRLARDRKSSLLVREFEAGQVYLVCDGMLIYQHAVGAVPADWMKTMERQPHAESSLNGLGLPWDPTRVEAEPVALPMYAGGRPEDVVSIVTSADDEPGEPAMENMTQITNGQVSASEDEVLLEGADRDEEPEVAVHVADRDTPPAPRPASSAWRSQPQSMDQMLTNYAKRWLRDFLGLPQHNDRQKKP